MKHSVCRRATAWLLAVAVISGGAFARGGEGATADAEKLGFNAERLGRVDAVLEESVGPGKLAGAVALIGTDKGVAYAGVLGQRSVEPSAEPMSRDTVFDMASLTKPIATATSVMTLIEEGKIRPSDRIVQYFPEMDNHGKGQITVDHLLRHRAGLTPDNALGDYKNGSDEAWAKICNLDLRARPGEKFIYSDVGFIILGKLVEKVSGKPLDQYAAERVFRVAGMTDAHFRPASGDAANWPKVERIAPTEPAEPGQPPLRGEVHDPRSRALGGVAGHAGLFATADDLAIYSRTMLDWGLSPTGGRLLSPLTVRLMLDPADTPAGQRRGLGWDVETGYSSPRGELFGPSSYGHTGFTGTSIWIDPETRTYVILLTSRLHPKEGSVSTITLRRRVATLAAAALNNPPARSERAAAHAPTASRPAPFSQVTCGVDVLAKRDFAPLRGKRVGLVTNHTGRSADGRSTIDVLFNAPDVKLVKLFSPEHGIRGVLDRDGIKNDIDETTKLPVISLYEGKKRKPQAEDLTDLDVLVYDIQDIGVRYYTYISTLGLVLEAAKENGKQVMVLDRPNPIDGLGVGGPIRDDDADRSFVAYHKIPIRHGMTVGELAKMYNAERKIDADLEVIPCEGWTRGATYDRTGLLWVNPSPNMRSLTEALLYPGVGWLEATNLATGRGTDTPFERVGAPWIEPTVWSGALNKLNLPGVTFTPVEFSPTERQYANERCGGVMIMITDWSTFDPIKLGLGLALTLRKEYRDQWNPDRLPVLLTNKETHQAILDGESIDQIEARWAEGLAEFETVRERYLIYPE